jgi:outer membrane protein assembly factor BamB
VTVVLVLGCAGAARADWPTYHADAARTGADQSTGAAAPFASGWTSTDLGGDIYAEPLIANGLVYIATQSNDVYALSAATGQVVWHRNAGAPVPASKLPCGDIDPTVGVTSTPVLDPARKLLFVVADVWDGSHAHHQLVAYGAGDGAPSSLQNIDPPGASPEHLLQRAALTLAGGRVIVAFGGNFGDCGAYLGWLVAANESGSGTPLYWHAGASNGAGLWAAGGPAVDANGYIYATTGNSTSHGSGYDDSEAIHKFDATLTRQDYFASPSWMSDDGADADLGSASPQLLDGGLIFQAGKNGNGYLVSTAAMGQVGGQVFMAPACRSFGADAFVPETIFVACADGIRAYSLDLGARRFTPIWHGPSDANGPPIVAAGLVWVTGYRAAKLYGLDPASGAVRVSRSTPAMAHFASPSASDGKLYLATDHTVEQYTIGVAGSGTPMPAAPAGCGQLAIGVRHARGLTRTRIVRVMVFVAGKRVGDFRGRDLRRVQVTGGAGRYTVRLVEYAAGRRRAMVYRLRYVGCKRVR